MKLFAEPTLEALRQKQCMKWTHYEGDVLPLWVADMDLPPADAIVEALTTRARSSNLGYPMGYPGAEPGVAEALAGWLETRYGWALGAEDIWPIHGIVPGLFLGARACASEGEGVLLPCPIYPPFISAIKHTGRTLQDSPMVWSGGRWEMDFDALEGAVTPSTRLLMICNPQNPTGRVYTRPELEALAELALRHRLWVLSDELHCDLIYGGHQHIPFASLSDEIAARTITLVGPTKTFNIAGLKIGFLIAQNRALQTHLKRVGAGFITPPNVMAQSAAKAAYTEGEPWLNETLTYLQTNRDRVSDFVTTYLPGAQYAAPEGTYLAWLDLRGLSADNALSDKLLQAGVALNDGHPYGLGGEGFMRLNFATTAEIVTKALERVRRGLELG